MPLKSKILELKSSLSCSWLFRRETKGRSKKFPIPVGFRNRRVAAARFQRMCFAATVIFGACASDSSPLLIPTCGVNCKVISMSKISHQSVATPTGLASVSTIPACKVNQLVQVAQKCQSTIAERGSDGVSQQDLQANSNLVLTAGW
ncbi:uncharacterized protein LOC133718671 [Rosa rugosa]|uniref:uncharacterized protein LOC133718671 n=1 Tax=Rosa rugosa TaxID=74645 RepID=UPI002B41191A|nr:uncharacterized protein LOC133718671 [Rosa rugosa]